MNELPGPGEIPAVPTPTPAGAKRPPEIGACFQLALLAAGQGNDNEAGQYLRQIIVAMKASVNPIKADA